MRSNLFASQMTAEAFAADVVDYAAGLGNDDLSKLIAFFHMASPDNANITLRVEDSGRLLLRIEADGQTE